MLTPSAGTVDFERWEKSFGEDVPTVDGIPLTRHWLIPHEVRPKMFMPHPTMSAEEIRTERKGYGIASIAWAQSGSAPGVLRH